MNFDEVETWVRAELPSPPARVLEIGAGDGELAASLAAAGWDVTAIDPRAAAPNVMQIALLDLVTDEPFDAAVGVVSLHHLEPLEASVAQLASLLRPGAPLLIDEFDVAKLDERAATWWLEQRGASDRETPRELIEAMQSHIRPFAELCGALEPWFELGAPVLGTYLYRHKLGESYRAAEERLVAAGELPKTGVRLRATRRQP